MGERSAERLHNQYRYGVYTGAGQMLAATMSAAVAFAMFRAAREERAGDAVSLRTGDEILAQAD